MSDSYSLNGTAFTRPTPSGNRDTSFFHDESPRPGLAHASIPLSPLKHYPTFNGGTYDRPSYISQLGLNSYTDYVNSNPSFAASRMPNYSDAAVAHAQTFPSVPLSSTLSPASASSYWSVTAADSRAHPSFHDPYNPYTYSKCFPSSYDTYNKSSFLRTAPYQENFNRSAFDTSRSYYRSPHDNISTTCTYTH
jgi:hypothetical protein